MPDLSWGEQRNVVAKLTQDLNGPRCAALLGEYRMGKTTALDSLWNQLPPPRACVSVAEIIAQNSQATDMHFYRALLEALLQDIPGGPLLDLSSEPPGGAQSQVARVSWFIQTVKQLADVPVTLLIDDADHLEEVAWGAGVLRGLRSLLNGVSQVRILLTGTGRLAEWGEALRRGGSGAGLWESVVSLQVRLTALSPAIIRDELRQHPQLAERLIALCGGHPFCLKRLTEDLALVTEPTKRLVEDVDLKARQLRDVWDEMFTAYWPALDLTARRVCFALASLHGRITTQMLHNRITDVAPAEIAAGITLLKDLGLVYEEADSASLHLIDLFRDWYAQIIGFVDGLYPGVADTLVAPVTAAAGDASVEFTFLPEQDVVVIRRERFVSLSELGIRVGRLPMIIRKTRQVIVNEDDAAFDNLQMLSSDLGVEVQQAAWYKEMCRAAETGQPVRVNIPVTLAEFPFELLPLSAEGLPRLGTQVPLSRRLISQGRDIQRPPLVVPCEPQARWRVLVVAPEVGGAIAIDPSGRIYQGSEAVDAVGQRITLESLRLRDEVRGLWDIFAARADLIQEVVFLTDEAITVQSRGELRIRRDRPTADVFRRLLRASEQQFDVLHFVGHGLTVADSPMKGGLIFEDSLIHLTELAGLLRNQQHLAFAYLSCCESATLANDPRTNGLVGLAHACVEAGVPAVLVMRWRIPAAASQRLTAAFYPAVFGAGRLDSALQQTVRQIYDEERLPARKVFAAVPVLIMH